jgi:hypothetical protein
LYPAKTQRRCLVVEFPAKTQRRKGKQVIFNFFKKSSSKLRAFASLREIKPPLLASLSCGLILFMVVLAAFVYVLFTVKDSDEQTYRKLVESANPVNSDARISPYTAQQKRRGVQKDVLFNQGNDRLQMRLISSESIMVLDHQDSGTEILEKMQDVKCFMQEEFFFVLPDGREALMQPNGKLLVRQSDSKDPSSWIEPNFPGIKPMQHVRYLEADNATYFYKSDRCLADKVKVSRYIAPGHDLLQSIDGLQPSMTGVAKKVEFSMAGKDLNFTAYQMKALFYEAGSL